MNCSICTSNFSNLSCKTAWAWDNVDFTELTTSIFSLPYSLTFLNPSEILFVISSKNPSSDDSVDSKNLLVIPGFSSLNFF